LSPQELKRLLAAHKELHKARVDKQKLLRKERQAIKEVVRLTQSTVEQD